MKFMIEKKVNLIEGKMSWLRRPRFLLPLLTAVIFAIYAIVLRPYLIPTMATVPVELFIAFILIAATVIAVLIGFVTLLVTLIIAIRTRTRVEITPWLLKLRSQLIIIVTITLVLGAFTMFTQKMAYTPPILGDNGKPIPGSIATLEKVRLGNSTQWITIRGKNKNKPVLLFLAGGPGGSQLASTRRQLKALEEHFVVVNWDQPGSAKSYDAVPIKAINPERYISDGHELTEYLIKKFNTKKIYVVGESWGSVLGIWLAQRYPELYHAFIGAAQMISFIETEFYNYDLALKIAKDSGDTKKHKQLTRQGSPPYYGKGVALKEGAYLMYLTAYMTKNPDIERPGYDTPGDVAGPEYGLYDKFNYFRGMITTLGHVYQQLYNFDLRKQAAKIDIPVYFIEGRHDVNAPPALVEEYYKVLKAPYKEIIWFEHSGHSPWLNERDKFVDRVVNVALKNTK